MKNSDNMKQAMYEMFGVGKAPEAPAAPAKAPTHTHTHAPAESKPVVKAAAPEAPASFLAAGTVFEGTLSARGDVEIAGDFKGSITTDGVVRLRSGIQSGITASSVELTGCVLTGDISATGLVTVDERSRVVGNISARELLCAGEVQGDLRAIDGVRLESRARVSGSIVTGAISVEKGASISGNVQIKALSEAKE